MKKDSVYIKTFILLWITILLFMSIALSFIDKIFGNAYKAPAVVICIILSLPATYFILKLVLAKSSKKPISVTYSELMKELQENGITDHLLELADRGITEVGSSAGDFVYLKMFAIAGCEYYIWKQDNDRALQYINLIDIKKVKGGDLSFLDGGVSVVSYFTAQMELSMAMKDPERANNVIADGKPFLDKFYGKKEALDGMIDSVWFMYHYVLQDYPQAQMHAQKIINNKVYKDEKNAIGHVSMAMICKRTGDDEGAARFMAEAHRLAEESGKALNKQNLESYYREFPNG
jgi:hypothetical protein